MGIFAGTKPRHANRARAEPSCWSDGLLAFEQAAQKEASTPIKLIPLQRLLVPRCLIGSFTCAVRGLMRTARPPQCYGRWKVRARVGSGCARPCILQADYRRPVDCRRR